MPRNASGTYTLPAGNPVSPGTVIESVWANNTMADLAAALSDSLSRTGQGGMLVPFKNADGTITAPGMTWSNEPTSGWYRKTANEFWYSIDGVDIFGITEAGVTLSPGLAAEGFVALVTIQDAEPAPGEASEGIQWFESDTGDFWLRYKNPDDTFTWIATNVVSGDWLAASEKGQPSGVASLDGSGKVPSAQLPTMTNTYGHGQCVFDYVSASAAIFKPYNGNLLIIDGSPRVIPLAGLTLANTTLAANDTTYFVYAYMSGVDVALELSATGHVTGAGGVEVKSSDPTRTLVGMIRKTGGNLLPMMTRSWFNRDAAAKTATTANTAQRSTTTTVPSFIELNTELRIPFLCWADELVGVNYWNYTFSSGSAYVYSGPGFDGAIPPNYYYGINFGSNGATANVNYRTKLTEGYHYGTVMGAVSGGTTGNFGLGGGFTISLGA